MSRGKYLSLEEAGKVEISVGEITNQLIEPINFQLTFSKKAIKDLKTTSYVQDSATMT